MVTGRTGRTVFHAGPPRADSGRSPAVRPPSGERNGAPGFTGPHLRSTAATGSLFKEELPGHTRLRAPLTLELDGRRADTGPGGQSTHCLVLGLGAAPGASPAAQIFCRKNGRVPQARFLPKPFGTDLPAPSGWMRAVFSPFSKMALGHFSRKDEVCTCPAGQNGG